MSSHENRESRFDEPPEPDRPIPQSGVPEAAGRKHSPEKDGRRPDGALDFDRPDPATSTPDAAEEDIWINPLSDIEPKDAGEPGLAAADDLAAADGDDDDDHHDDGDDDEESFADRWDANDPRRKNDCFAPPTEPCECHCLHCGRTFSSEGIWFQKVINDPQKFKGFWMCPTPNCSGAGFTFDIFPTDPDHPANEGWHYDDEEEFDEDEFDDEDDDNPPEWSESAIDGDDEDQEYDPAEPHFKELDDFYGDEDDDIAGEEWKYGLQPGERPPEPVWREEARREWEEDQKRYDEPDQRPRVLDWSDREDRLDENYNRPRDGQFSDDDIPF